MFKRKPKVLTPQEMEEIRTKDFFDCILPGTIKFLSDHYIVGDSYRCVWAIREYPPSTEEQAILSQLADRNGVTLRIYHRLVESMEQRKIIQNATRKNKLMSGGNDVNETIEAEGNLQDVIELLANLRKNREPLLHCSVFIELKAKSMDELKELQSEIAMELTRSKISVDRLTLRQKEGFLSVLPVGANQFGAQYERVLPASSVANLYPFNFSGKTDPHGIYIGRDKFGTNILVDFDRRSEDKTTSNILILGNSGQGKSYLLKLILTNLRESGKSVIVLDAEAEYQDLTESLGGCYIDFMSGEYIVNPLEPKAWSDGQAEPAPTSRNINSINSSAGDRAEDGYVPEAFRRVTRLPLLMPDLFSFAYVPNWYSQLDMLAEMSLPEPWRFKNPIYLTKNPDTPILERYIHAIFKKQLIDYKDERNPSSAADYFHIENEFCCFHTGLYTRRYKAIYACFDRNKKKDSLLEWYFRGFADELSPMLRHISPLPKKPSYYMTQYGVNYNPEWPIRVNVDHILGDEENLSRIPAEIREAQNLPLLLETAVELARRKAVVEPSIVVPQGYQGRVQYLLPICLTDMEQPDLAMTLTIMDGYYLGNTCLTLEMAYLNARLLSRPVAHWLTDIVEE